MHIKRQSEVMLGRRPKDFRYVFPSQGKAMIRHNRIILGWSIVADHLPPGLSLFCFGLSAAATCGERLKAHCLG